MRSTSAPTVPNACRRNRKNVRPLGERTFFYVPRGGHFLLAMSFTTSMPAPKSGTAQGEIFGRLRHRHAAQGRVAACGRGLLLGKLVLEQEVDRHAEQTAHLHDLIHIGHGLRALRLRRARCLFDGQSIPLFAVADKKDGQEICQSTVARRAENGSARSFFRNGSPWASICGTYSKGERRCW